ncbi:MAG: glycoside hydrolase family 43 protein [Chitinispirillaceae bacterium]|nr:glycoside hydrolase family 43 protein [Chitinispirillaceae bacterium]
MNRGKVILQICILYLLLIKIGISKGENPIVQTIYTADPAPLVYNDTLFVYTTHDEDTIVNNFFTMRDWRCYSTTDMVNWRDRGRVASLKDFKWVTADNGAWAPHCIYRNGKFYLYCPIHTKGIGVLVSEKPDGPFRDPLGKPLINNSSADIDPAVFIDDDGQAYLYWGNPDCMYVRLNNDMISYSGNIVKHPMTVESFGPRSKNDRPTSYEEGPWLYKRNSLYYLVFAAGPLPEHLAYATSTSPIGPWKYRGVVMPQQGGSFTNHPGIIEYKGNWYLFYHNADLPGGGGFHRSVCVEKFEYNPDGTIPTINMTRKGAPQIRYLNPYDTIQAETICWEVGIETAECSEGGVCVDSIHNNDYIKVKGVDFGTGPNGFIARVSSYSEGGKIELRIDTLTGKEIGTCTVKNTGGWDKWVTVGCSVTTITGVHDLFLKFTGAGKYPLFKFNWWKFTQANTTNIGIQNNTTNKKYLSILYVKSGSTISLNLSALYFLDKVNVNLFDARGKHIALLWEGQPSLTPIVFSLQNMKGIFFVKITRGYKTILTEKIIVL